MYRGAALTAGTLISYWIALMLATGLGSARYAVRKQRNGELLWDDWIHLAALLQCTVYVVTLELTDWDDTADFYQPSNYINGELWRFSTVNTTFFWTTIFTSKVVFLALYRRAFGVSRRFLMFWWAVVAVTVIAFLMCFLSQFFVCGGSAKNFRYVGVACENYGWHWARIAIMSIVCNGTTDILLMLLPMGMLYRLQMRRSEKLKLSGVFMLGALIIVFDVLGWIYQAWPRNILLTFIFRNLEPEISVIISALPAFLHLVSRKRSDGSEDTLRQGNDCVHSSLRYNRWLRAGRRLFPRGESDLAVTEEVVAPKSESANVA